MPGGSGGHPTHEHGHRQRKRRSRRSVNPRPQDVGEEVPTKVFYSTTLDDLMLRVKVMGLVRDRTLRFKSHSACVVGRELVDFLVTTRQCATRGEAVELGKLLVTQGYLKHVSDDSQFFADDLVFFQLGQGMSSRRISLPPPADDRSPQFEPVARALAPAVLQEEYFDRPRGRAGSGYIKLSPELGPSTGYQPDDPAADAGADPDADAS